LPPQYTVARKTVNPTWMHRLPLTMQCCASHQQNNHMFEPERADHITCAVIFTKSQSQTT